MMTQKSELAEPQKAKDELNLVAVNDILWMNRKLFT